MNWDAIGAIGEIIGAFAVVLSLVYLSVQIRKQSEESKIAAMHDIAVGFRDSVVAFADAELADIFIKSNHDPESLSERERLQLITSVLRVLRLWEEAFLMHSKDRLEEDQWQSMVRQIRPILSTPAVQWVWKLRKNILNDRFRDFMEELATEKYSLGDDLE